MLSEDLRKRIARLNRRSLRHAEEEEKPQEETPREEAHAPRRRPPPQRDVPPVPPVPLRVTATPADARLTLSLDEVTEGEEVCSDAGRFLQIEKSFSDMVPGSEGFCTRYVRALSFSDALGHPGQLHPDFHPLADVGPEALLFVDIEATGLTAGTPLFLIGALTCDGNSLNARQLLARDYAEEAALLAHFSEMLEASEVVASFNGKTYDLPYIRDRCLFHGVPFRLRQHHLDLIYESRRRWRGRLPNCKLQTLERFICRRMRSGDIPGAEIPDAYHRFVQTGNAVQMRDILHHNALDLVTMAELLVFMLEGRDL